VKYQALLAYNISCYVTIDFDAQDNDAAVDEAMRQLEGRSEYGLVFYPEFGEEFGDRIVEVVRITQDEGPVCVAEDIDLDPNPLTDNAFRLLQAAKGFAAFLSVWRYDIDKATTPLHAAWESVAEAIDACEGGEIA
jgi:hypothetical protein